jgi:tetratricopeptide (TPR) repeat protein
MGLFSRRDSERKREPPAPRSGQSIFAEDQFLIPRGVPWTIQDLNTLEAQGAFQDALEKWRILLSPFEDPRFAAQIQGHKSHRVIWLHIGFCSRRLGRFDEALQAYNKAGSLAREAGDRDMLFLVTNNIGVVYKNRGDIETALRYFESALLQAEELKDPEHLAVVHDNLAHSHLLKGDLQRGVREAEAAYAKLSSDPSKVSGSVQSRILGNLGYAYLEMGEKTRGVEFLERGLVKAREAGDRVQESVILENLEKAKSL